MGGDHAPEVTLAGAVAAARAGLSVLLVGDEAMIRPQLPRGLDLQIRHAPEVIGMGDAPVAAVRQHPGASLCQAVQAVSEGQAAAAVSCGNTGAVMAAAVILCGRMARVRRPCLTTVIPRSDGGQLVLLDLGANVDCQPRHIAQFAQLGHGYASLALDLPRPRIGLLSNGDEPGKGNEQVRAAEALIAKLPLNFVGQIEPPVALGGGCDVLVCDGFVGNVMLKTVEATAEVVGSLLREELLRQPLDRLGAWLLRGALARFRKRINYGAFGGGMLLGIEGVVIVGHGRSDAGAVCGALLRADQYTRQGLLPRLHEVLAL